jgi:hypothetical protein
MGKVRIFQQTLQANDQPIHNPSTIGRITRLGLKLFPTVAAVCPCPTAPAIHQLQSGAGGRKSRMVYIRRGSDSRKICSSVPPVLRFLAAVRAREGGKSTAWRQQFTGDDNSSTGLVLEWVEFSPG